MRIQTFSVVAGSTACNARCPFCVSRMTPRHEMDLAQPQVNWRNFEIACRFSKDHRVSTVLITGKGEPTLFPEQLTGYLEHLRPHAFPFVELQTNGIALAEGGIARQQLQSWYDLGLTLVALSVVDCASERNRVVYQPHAASYHDLAELVACLHAVGLSVRLSCTMLKDHVDSVEAMERMVVFCKEHEVEQLTLRPVELPERSRDTEAARWVEENRPPESLVCELREHLDAEGTRLMELLHGAVVYDLHGQNLCLSNCLTLDPGDERIRQLIFFPDGHLRYDWQYAGAVLL